MEQVVQIVELTPKQYKAALYLARGFSIDQTAQLVSVNEKTIDKWKQKIPEFNQQVKIFVRDIYREGIQQAVNDVNKATAYFRHVLENDDETTTNRMRAGKFLVDIAGIAISLDLEDRVKALEEMANEE